MGIVKAAASAVGSGLGDQWLEVIQADNMGPETVFTGGVALRPGKGANTRGSVGIVSNGSRILVAPNQFMLLADGGKVIDYTAEPGYYEVNNSSSPSLFNGEFGEALKEVFSRIKYGGVSSKGQQVYFINTQEIKGNKFGTPNPVNYFDSFYNAELFLRAHGDYSIRIVNPLLFFSEVIPRNASHVDFSEINEQYRSEFLEAFQAALNQMSVDGERISFVTSRAGVLSRYMDDALDETWKKLRGMEVVRVGIASLSYDETSQKLINMRNQGAMMGDPSIREGYVQSSIAEGIQAAGSNPNGAAIGMMGVGMGMSGGLGYMGMASQTNMQQMQMNQAANQRFEQPKEGGLNSGGASASKEGEWVCSCGTENSGKFCTECGKPRPASETWICSCGTENSGKFCTECGKPRPVSGEWVCSCGAVNSGKFCTECGKPRQ